ncbi:MAG: hypothetical protein FJ403_08660 [Verrucomicrobia bacterium]|nr:hypothetical protein [Verrucomicrobiota bacterium]
MRTKAIGLACALAALVTCIAAVKSRPPNITPFEREQVRGQVRVVLLKVERATVFTSDGVREGREGKVYPVPMFGVTYLVEALGDEPIKSWFSNHSYDDYMVGNQRLDDGACLPENVVPGGSGFTLGLSHLDGPIALPAFKERKRAYIGQQFIRAAQIPHGKLRLKIVAGINDHPEAFWFHDVPLE